MGSDGRPQLGGHNLGTWGGPQLQVPLPRSLPLPLPLHAGPTQTVHTCLRGTLYHSAILVCTVLYCTTVGGGRLISSRIAGTKLIGTYRHRIASGHRIHLSHPRQPGDSPPPPRGVDAHRTIPEVKSRVSNEGELVVP